MLNPEVKKQSIEINMLELSDKDFKTDIVNVIINLKKKYAFNRGIHRDSQESNASIKKNLIKS